MKQLYQYFKKSNLIYLADCSGMLASCLCFVHCWLLPLLLIFLPGLVQHNNWVHPVLCSIAILSTIPMLLKKTIIGQNSFVQFAVGFGNTFMLIILFNHNHLSERIEMLLNTMGGLCLAYVHYKNLKIKRSN